jgi:ribosomal-protein-alanine acetyltransferase
MQTTSLMNLIIRKATEADIDAVCAIERDGHARWNRRQFADELDLNFSRFYVMEDGGVIIGFAVAWVVADEIQLNDIGISRDRRREGLATRLLDHIIRDARETRRPGKVVLEVSERNDAARMFYGKNGFVETGRRAGYYDAIDAILMERVLEP